MYLYKALIIKKTPLFLPCPNKTPPKTLKKNPKTNEQADIYYLI